ncbi:ribosome small subunit-dependent GTPase A [bacterium]|nr:ribosome small subunit-dependent GTPase A [bacterium]
MLETFGWNTFFENSFLHNYPEDFTVGRIALEHKERYELYTSIGEVWGEVSGKLRYTAAGRADFPAVGDWVVIDLRAQERSATIHSVLPRKTKFSRKVAGIEAEEQIVAANVDKVFIVNGLDADFSPRRIERYLILTRESGAEPIIVLNKADIATDLNNQIQSIEAIASAIPVITLSATNDDTPSRFNSWLRPNETAVFMGSSGVGKSTIINALIGHDHLKTQEVRVADSRGKHTTTHRELIKLASGALVIDTPGMRELQLWASEEGLNQTFSDIEALAAQCRFKDCHHDQEPGCAVKAALENGTLDEKRYKNYRKMLRELHYLELRQDNNAARLERKKWKKIHADMKRNPKRK